MIAICKSVFNSKIDFTGNLSHTWSREWFISALPFSNLKILGEILFFQRIFKMIIISILDREKNTYGHASSSSLKVTIFPSQKAYLNRALSLLSDGSEISFSIRGLGHHRQSPFIPLMENAWTLGSTENAKSSRNRGIMPFKRWFRWTPNTNLRQITSKINRFVFFVTISSNCSILFYSEQTSNDQSEW